MRAAVSAIFLSCLAASVAAQEGAVEQVRMRTSAVLLRETAELKMIGEERGEVVELSLAEVRTPRFRVTVAMNIEHQSNALLDPDHHRDDWLFLPSLEVGYRTPLIGALTLDLSVRADLARYLRHEESTYWGPSGTALLEYRVRQNLPRLYLGAQAYRYDLIDPAEEITRAGALIAGTDHSLTFFGGKTIASAGYQFARFWASPRVEDRDAHTLFGSVTQQLVGSLYAQVSYAWQYSIFENQDRADARHLTGFAFIYLLSDDSFLRLYTTYQRNDSTEPRADYDNFTGGLGASLTVRF